MNRLVCSPTRFTSTHTVPGTIPVTADCGHEVFASPVTQDLMHKGIATTVCVECLTLEDVAAIKANGLNITAAQRREVNKEVGVAATDQFIARAGVTQRELT